MQNIMSETATMKVQIGLRVDPEMLGDFDRVAERNLRSRSAEIEMLMQRHVAANARKIEAAEEKAAA